MIVQSKRSQTARAGSILLVLLLALASPASAGLYTDSCGMVWADAASPFERNNETAYNEELMASYTPIMANLTDGPPDFSSMTWSDAFRETCAYMEERYAFTEWRGVDWDAKDRAEDLRLAHGSTLRVTRHGINKADT